MLQPAYARPVLQLKGLPPERSWLKANWGVLFDKMQSQVGIREGSEIFKELLLLQWDNCYCIVLIQRLQMLKETLTAYIF